METTDPDSHNEEVELLLITEGKTKKIASVPVDPSFCWVISKDDVTAGDGAKHDVIPGKGALATTTTCNVFKLLKAHGIHTAFIEQIDSRIFSAHRCNMLPYEVVVRGRAWGSYLKRNPGVEKGQPFPTPVVEFFLKTKDRRWKEHNLPCDDPLLIYTPGGLDMELHYPNQPTHHTSRFLTLRANEVLSHPNEWRLFQTMEHLTRLVFLILEEEWRRQGKQFIDLKLEFGLHHGQLLLADVVDADSWRLLDENGDPLSKQLYREDGSLEDMLRVYEHVAALTGKFLPGEHEFGRP
jgi:phosphoribosylaminoimidazole-succinocarboxamide synthase